MEETIILKIGVEYIYVYVPRIEGDLDKLDISFFEEEEWEKIIKMSKIFETAVDGINSQSDYAYSNTDKDYKKAAYFLYQSKFKHFYLGFSDLETGTLDKQDIHEMVFDHISNGDNLTINKFRKWLANEFGNFRQYYEFLLKE